jgi:predicted nucleic acid-binding protein
MSTRFLIDTNVLIRCIEGIEPDATFMKQAISKNALVFSVIVIAEFLTKASQREQGVLNDFLQTFSALAIDERVARKAGKYRSDAGKSKRIHLLDFFLAAQAHQHGYTLVTNNTKDFPMKDIRVVRPGEV